MNNEAILTLSVDASEPRVLVVDDEEDLRDLLMELLRSRGFSVDQASNGREAWDRIVAFSPDVVILDLAMPMLDGWKLTSLVRTDRRWKHIGLVALTGQAVPDAVQDAKDAGVDDVLIKPTDPDRLVETLHRLIARKPRRLTTPPTA